MLAFFLSSEFFSAAFIDKGRAAALDIDPNPVIIAGNMFFMYFENTDILNLDNNKYCNVTNPYADIINTTKNDKYFEHITESIPSYCNFKDVPTMKNGINGIRILKKYFVKFSKIIEVFFTNSKFLIPQSAPEINPDMSAMSLEINFFI